MAVTFDKSSSRYRDEKGRFVSENYVRGTVEKSTKIFENDLRSIAKELNAGKINLAEFQIQAADKIETAHIFNASIGKGGREQLNLSDWGKLGVEIREQYKYLNNFAREIESGKLSPNQIEYRASLYSKAPRSTYFKNEMDLRGTVKTLAKRVLHALESCSECVTWADKGFIAIDEQPPIGSLICKSFCRCTIEYK